jgi:hypothetical protein
MIEEAIPVIERLGYGPEEAEFLCLAAVHSGYFVRRQFNDFIGHGRGGAAQRFIEKLLGRHHARYTRFRLNHVIYHVRAKKVYNRLGQSDNRNRREKATVTIKRKLMCLDFVLAHRHERFLSTEFEKVGYFNGERGVALSNLPVRRYSSNRSGAATDRYFVDKLPVYVTASQDSLASPVVHFAYVDEGAETLQGFETFLNQYSALLEALRAFELVYVAAGTPRLQEAERCLRRRLAAGSAAPRSPSDPEVLRLLDFFRTRRKVDLKDMRGLDAQRIIRLRDERKEFSGGEFETLYEAWKSGGDAVLMHPGTPSLPDGVQFRGILLPYDYDLFGEVRRAS